MLIWIVFMVVNAEYQQQQQQQQHHRAEHESSGETIAMFSGRFVRFGEWHPW